MRLNALGLLERPREALGRAIQPRFDDQCVDGDPLEPHLAQRPLPHVMVRPASGLMGLADRMGPALQAAGV